MRMFMFLSGPNICAFALIFLLLSSSSSAIRSFPNSNDDMDKDADLLEFKFIEAPEYQNGVECSVPSTDTIVHIAMTLDSEYLRGSIAAIHSVLKHASCPDNIYFHFIASSEFKSLSLNPTDLTRIIKSTFPALGFEVYPFDGDIVRRFISPSIRKALDDPLNYARIYLADMLDINRVIYLDSDIIVVDDIQKLWSTPLTGSKAIGAPEYCHVDLKSYFSDEFWSDQELRKVLEDKNRNNNKRACYFNTGVMVMDLGRWREGNYRRRIEKYMEKQRERRIYKLGSLPPFLLVFGGDIEAVDHRWNQHGLGGDNVANSCRSLHPGPVSLLHWSGKGKPWVRLDQGRPCPVDYLWEPYDLHRKTLAL